MTLRIVQLGTPRSRGEGLRVGTVRHPPRGVPKARHATDDWYDLWYPTLAPSAATVKLGTGARSPVEVSAFRRRYRAEMALPAARDAIRLVAALSHVADLSVGCYCDDETRCHRYVLRELLAAAGARIG
jgi:uncharacterized protein YeaO (DUF488 family)